MSFNNYSINNIKGHSLVFVPGFLAGEDDQAAVTKKLMASGQFQKHLSQETRYKIR